MSARRVGGAAAPRRSAWSGAPSLPRSQAQVAGMGGRAPATGWPLLNLDEGDGALRLGNLLKAREHLQLALRARPAQPALRERVDAAAGQPGTRRGWSRQRRRTAAAGCGSGCGPSCAPTAVAGRGADELDAGGRLELLLATLPAELAARYSGRRADLSPGLAGGPGG
ncbi:MAG: hypothetical protein MZU95_13820 [Desulfomicrobium escambiense]|nr:hypothetical protein [Desulfomicrobium escambiense]